MLFGLLNALVSFQGYINKILAKKLGVFIIVYPDDILIYTKDQCQAQIEAMRWMFDLLKKNSLFTNLKKCRFYKKKVCFLGYIVLAQRVKIKDEKIKTVNNWPEQTLLRDIQIFIGLVNFYQCFI